MPLNNISGETDRRDVVIGDFGYDEVSKRFRPPPLAGAAEAIIYASRSDSDTGVNVQSDTTSPAVLPPTGGPQLHDVVTGQTLSVNDDLGFRLSDPLPSFWAIGSTLAAGMDWKYFKSRLFQTRTFSTLEFVEIGNQPGPPFTIVQPVAPPTSVTQELLKRVNYLPISASWDATRGDKWGSTGFSFNNSVNLASILGNEQDFRNAAGNQKANGHYYIATAQFVREQKLIADWSLRVSADGQWANQPLISNEQFGIGGLAGVRGYRDGQEYGDTGWRVLFEPHTDLFDIGMVDGTKPMLVRFSLFTDYGQRFLIDQPVGTTGSVAMWGAGFGFSGSIGERMDFRFTYGMPLLDTPTVRAGTARVSFSVAMQF